MVILRVLIALLAPACLGCVSISPAMGLRAAPAGESDPGAGTAVDHRPETPGGDTQPADSRWPARWGKAGSPRGVIVPCETPADRLRSAHLGRYHQLRTGETEYAQAAALASGVGVTDGFRFETEGPGSLVFLEPFDPRLIQPEPKGEAAKEDPNAPAETFVFVSGRVLDRHDGEDRVALERTWIAFYDAIGDETKGTIMLVPGMLGTPEPIIEGMVRYWRHAGYAVIRLMSHPSRFTERVEVTVRPGEEEAVGQRLAAIYDQRTAECAYACDAALTHAIASHEAIRDKPVVLVGMSGGAMVLPTVYAYAPQRYKAAVLIAGGENFLKISALSNYADWIDAVVLDWAPDDAGSNGRPTPEALEHVSDAYVAAARLDAMDTASELDAPVLVLHATNDKAVPSFLGDALWRRLGTPERWVYPVGHELIFGMLPTQAGRLQKWIDDAIGRGG